ncbi:MAG: restriction endonuclease subunit S [Lactococcus chungangensis]
MMSKKSPQLRFEGFTDDWEQRKLSSMTNYKNGKSHEDKQSTSGKLELINLNSISISGGLKHSGKFIDEADDTLQKDDLVMILSDVGHGDLLGRVALIPEDDRFVLNQRVALLRPNTTADPQFLFSYINAHQYYFKAQGAGMSQLNISKGSVENFISFVPIIEEQKKIGAFYKRLDDTIALHQRNLDLLKEQKKGFLQKMFPKNGAKVPELRFAGFADDWEERKLGDYVIIRSGWSPSNFDINNNANNLFIKVDDLNYSTRVQEESQVKVNILSKYKKMKKSSTIFPKRGAAIMTNKVRMLGEDSYMDTNMMALEPKGIDPEYLYTFINKTRLYKIADTSTVPQINNKHIEPYLLLIPSLEEQHKIGSFFKQLDGTIALHQRKLDLLKEQKKGFLQKMFV